MIDTIKIITNKGIQTLHDVEIWNRDLYNLEKAGFPLEDFSTLETIKPHDIPAMLEILLKRYGIEEYALQNTSPKCIKDYVKILTELMQDAFPSDGSEGNETGE